MAIVSFHKNNYFYAVIENVQAAIDAAQTSSTHDMIAIAAELAMEAREFVGKKKNSIVQANVEKKEQVGKQVMEENEKKEKVKIKRVIQKEQEAVEVIQNQEDAEEPVVNKYEVTQKVVTDEEKEVEEETKINVSTIEVEIKDVAEDKRKLEMLETKDEVDRIAVQRHKTTST